MKGNMYETALAETWALFGDYACGSETALTCAVSTSPLTIEAQRALNSSFATFGYGRDATTFVVIRGTSGQEQPLDPQALFTLIEGFDPLLLVATDADATRLLAEAYRCALPLDDASRAFGRTVVAFRNFEALMESAQTKQVAWALLKRLPKFGEY